MLEIRARRVLGVLLAANAVLVSGYLILPSVPISSRALTRWFDLSAEASIAPWYNGGILLVAGLLALLRGVHLRALDHGSHWKAYVLLAAGLVFLSADEVAQIHETLSGTMHRRMAVATGRLTDVQAWDVVTFAIYCSAGLAMFALLRRDVITSLREVPGRTALLAGAILLVTGAILVDQLHVGMPGRLRIAIEDGMELTGAALMLYGLLLKLGSITVRIVAAQPARAVATPPAALSRQQAAPVYEEDELANLA